MKVSYPGLYGDIEGIVSGSKTYVAENETDKIQLIRIAQLSESDGINNDDIHLINIAFNNKVNIENIVRQLNISGIPNNNGKIKEIFEIKLIDKTPATFTFSKINFDSYLSCVIKLCIKSREDQLMFEKRTFYILKKMAAITEFDKNTYYDILKCYRLKSYFIEERKEDMVMAASCGLGVTFFGLAGRDIGQRIGYFLPSTMASSLPRVNKACAEEVRKLPKL